MKINKWLAIGLTAMVFLSAGCSPIVKEGEVEKPATVAMDYNLAHYPVTIHSIDSKGEDFAETFDRPPQRVVAVWQNSIETLLALGVGDRIVAAMGLPDGKYLRPEYQADYAKIPYTSMQNLDVETVMMQDPDFVVGWRSTFTTKTLRGTDFWDTRKIHTYISPGSSWSVKTHVVEDEYRDILNMGKVFDREDQAEEIVNQMKDKIQEAEEQAASTGKHPRGLIVETMGKETRVYGKDTLAGNILTSMGGELLAPEEQSLSKEQVIEMNPDAVFLVVSERGYTQADQTIERWCSEKAFQELDCVKNKRVYALPLYAIYSAGVRTLDGIQIIGKGLYPELYGGN